ncbi:toxin-antitoxin system YwqK family antitoxin [Bhargavaea beijingensis]|uniref:toxin-antitoxin system YwqK family antitoxin n=1 Tax=Bhargavaea beijingensis TaxID=426756 RepID=UPI0022242EB9|nr:hypothetical protein [Bhargavaea beijingensis]MCW1927266.1 hypothetical protein [Bhargavaea beijingensis]
MKDILLSKEEVVRIGYNYGELEMDPPDDILFVPEGDSMDDWVPVTGVVYDLDGDEKTLLFYGEYDSGLPHGISVNFHYNGQMERICHIFHGAIDGEDKKWDSAGNLIFQGEYVYGILVRYKKWTSSGELIEQQTEPAEDMLELIEAQRTFNETHDWKNQ